MDLRLSEEHVILTGAARDFVRRDIAPLERHLDPRADEIPFELRQEARQRSAAAGFYGADYPERLGGQGLSRAGSVALKQAVASTGSRLADDVVGGPEGPTRLLLEGTPEQQERYLRPLVEGRSTRCIAATEPEAGSDLSALQTRAERADDRWVLNGTKQFVSNARHADVALVFARTLDAAGTELGISIFAVETRQDGFVVGRPQTGMVDSETQFEVILEDCAVPDDGVLGGADGVGMGTYQALIGFEDGRLSIAASCNGIARFALRLALAYAKRRVAFGGPIGNNQYIQGYLVDSAMELRASELLAYDAATRLDQGLDAAEECCRAKLYASEMAWRVLDRAIQVFGGMGWMRDLPLERMARLVRMWRIVDGTSEIQRHMLWQFMDGEPRGAAPRGHGRREPTLQAHGVGTS